MFILKNPFSSQSWLESFFCKWAAVSRGVHKLSKCTEWLSAQPGWDIFYSHPTQMALRPSRERRWKEHKKQKMGRIVMNSIFWTWHVHHTHGVTAAVVPCTRPVLDQANQNPAQRRQVISTPHRLAVYSWWKTEIHSFLSVWPLVGSSAPEGGLTSITIWAALSSLWMKKEEEKSLRLGGSELEGRH